ncbi:hypothetical protein D3C81_1691190 [compost metagenome]
MENQELRRLLSSAGEEEKYGWLRSAAELGITLISGVDDSSEALGNIQPGESEPIQISRELLPGRADDTDKADPLEGGRTG